MNRDNLIGAMVIEAMAFNMGGVRRIHGGELENFPWLWYHIEVAQDKSLMGCSCIYKMYNMMIYTTDNNIVEIKEHNLKLLYDR